MIMDSRFTEFSDSLDGFEFNDEFLLPNSDQYPNLENGFKFKDESVDLSFMENRFLSPDPDPDPGVSAQFLSFSPEGGGGSSSSDSDLSDPVLKYISQMLMEEDMEEKPSMLHDSLALHVAEKSLYDALGHTNPLSPNQPPFSLDSPDDNVSSGFSDYSSNSTNSNGTSNWVPDPPYIGDIGEYKPYPQQVVPAHVNYISQFTSESKPQSSFNSSNSFSNNVNGFMDTPVNGLQLPDFFSDKESILQFNKGVEEASKFLPKSSNLIVDLDNYTLAPERKKVVGEVVVKVEEEEEEREHSPNGSRGRKREDLDLEEERVNKQSAVSVEEEELSEMFDKVLLSCLVKQEPPHSTVTDVLKNGPSNSLQQNGQPQGSNGGKGRAKKQGNRREVVDLRTLLILCAQSVSTDDRRTANELLKQIRQHSSPLGDGSQRLAHCFANGLEARLAGTGTQIYTALASKRTSAADILKAYQLYLQSCPFKKISMSFANQMISKVAEKEETLHIIDFGILYGFQWPILIQCLSHRDGGPPKLRVTGIELPQSGFRPAERVEETGRRLKKYCERFHVPFEYNAIAQNWDTIQVEDLKIDPSEVVAVNCLYRFKNLLDETVMVNSPRNAVLNLIRKIKPNIFTHSVVNGSYNAPFFVTRFREALFHFSALFDMFDTVVPREDQERLMYEREFCGREVINVIACEGSERVERPETYKQWQVRNVRAGFRQLPLDQELMNKLKGKVKAWYHKDFVIDEDGCWMLLGWKGRIVCASSCWIPA